MFCGLADPTSMKARLKKLSIATCNELALKSQYRTQFAAFKVTDATKVSIIGDRATIFSTAFKPSTFIYFAVLLRKDAGHWKVETV